MKAETRKVETALWVGALLSGATWPLWVSGEESLGMSWEGKEAVRQFAAAE